MPGGGEVRSQVIVCACCEKHSYERLHECPGERSQAAVRASGECHSRVRVNARSGARSYSRTGGGMRSQVTLQAGDGVHLYATVCMR